MVRVEVDECVCVCDRLGSDRDVVQRFFFVVHTFKEGKAEEWWKGIAEVLSADDQPAKMREQQKSLGFYNHFFLPMGGDNPVLCLWEAKEAVSIDAFQAYIDGPDGPAGDAMINTVYPLIAGSSIPSPSAFSGEAAATAKPTGGAMFWIMHTFKSDEAQEKFWAYMSNDHDAEKYTASNRENGFDNPFFLASGPAGPFACIWESKQDISSEEMLAFMNSEKGPVPGTMDHKVHKIDVSSAFAPSAYFV